MRLFDLQTHVPANSSKVGVFLEVIVHGKDGVFSSLKPYINENDIVRVEFLAKAIEEPIMR